MSSTYRLICLSHDPGLVLDAEWHSGADGRNTSAGALLSREGSAEIESHTQCDMAIGRYSYSLTEVGYVEYGSTVRWIDAEWLSVLAALPEPPAKWPRGWTADRIHRLRRHL